MVVLINHQGLKVYKGLQLQSPSPPIGLAYISAFLKSKDIAYQTIDACGESLNQLRRHPLVSSAIIQGLTNDEVVKKIDKCARIIGITCNFSSSWPLVADMVREIRKAFPQAFYVLGGEHGTAFPESSLSGQLFDCVVCGEGEETFSELVQIYCAGGNWKLVSGICHLEDDMIVHTTPRKRITQIDDMPIPEWDDWHIKNYIENSQISGVHLGRTIPILGSRGCPYTCKFCSNKDMWTTRYIMRDPAKLVDEMQFLKKKYSLDGFVFMDSTFVINRNKTYQFAKELTNRALDVNYQLPAGTRCEAFDKELAQALCESGLKNFAFAPESGSPYILEKIRKKISLPTFLESCKCVLSTKMTTSCFFVIGFPEDSDATLKETLSLIRKISVMGIHDITVSQFTPYPGSDYFRELVKEGKLNISNENFSQILDFYSSSHVSYCPKLSSVRLYYWMIWMYLNFYIISFALHPWRVICNFASYFSSGNENTRYMRLFAEVFVKRKKWRENLN